MSNLKISSGYSCSREDRRGVAATELAVCLPVIVLLVLGTIEACTMIFLKQSLTIAAYEGVRMALADGSTSRDVEDVCNQVLSNRRVRGAQVTISPSDITSLQPGQYVTVTVSAPSESNAVLRSMFYRGKTLSSAASMMNEFGTSTSVPPPPPPPFFPPFPPRRPGPPRRSF